MSLVSTGTIFELFYDHQQLWKVFISQIYGLFTLTVFGKFTLTNLNQRLGSIDKPLSNNTTSPTSGKKVFFIYRSFDLNYKVLYFKIYHISVFHIRSVA